MADLDHSGELDIQVPNTSLRYFLPAMLTKMSLQEFAAFLHPEDAEHMRDIVVQETLEDIDKDGDGHVRIPIEKFSSWETKRDVIQVNIDEYIGDMYRDEGGEEGEHGNVLIDVIPLLSTCFSNTFELSFSNHGLIIWS